MIIAEIVTKIISKIPGILFISITININIKNMPESIFFQKSFQPSNKKAIQVKIKLYP